MKNTTWFKEDDTDILLLGPQLGFELEKFRDKGKEKDIVVHVIDIMDYGIMDGEKVLMDALKLID